MGGATYLRGIDIKKSSCLTDDGLWDFGECWVGKGREGVNLLFCLLNKLHQFLTQCFPKCIEKENININQLK